MSQAHKIVDQTLSSRLNDPPKVQSPKIIRRKPEYGLYKRVVEQKHKKTESKQELIGFYSPRRNIVDAKSLLSTTVQVKKLGSSFIKVPTENNKKSTNVSSNTTDGQIRSPKVSISRFNGQTFWDRELKVSNKQNSTQRLSSRQSLVSNKNQLILQNNRLREQNNVFKKQLENLKSENSILHSQIHSNHQEIQILIEYQKQNKLLKKQAAAFKQELTKKQQQICRLQQKITKMNKKFSQMQKQSSHKNLQTVGSMSSIDEINHQNMFTIKKLTEANKQLEIQLYMHKNKQHQYLKNSIKVKQCESLVLKNKQLRISNLKLRQKLQNLARSSILQYSPDITER